MSLDSDARSRAGIESLSLGAAVSAHVKHLWWSNCAIRLSFAFVLVVASATFWAECGLAQTLFRDEFSGPSLQSGWMIKRANESMWKLAGGRLWIAIEEGGLPDPTLNYPPCRNLFLREAPTGDFLIESQLDTRLLGREGGGHIVLYVDDSTYLSFGISMYLGERYVSVSELAEGDHLESSMTYLPGASAPVPSGPVVLRMAKVGGIALLQYRADGKWVRCFSTQWPSTPKFAGLVAYDILTAPDSSFGVYDYFAIARTDSHGMQRSLTLSTTVAIKQSTAAMIAHEPDAELLATIEIFDGARYYTHAASRYRLINSPIVVPYRLEFTIDSEVIARNGNDWRPRLRVRSGPKGFDPSDALFEADIPINWGKQVGSGGKVAIPQALNASGIPIVYELTPAHLPEADK